MSKELLDNIERIHTTDMGKARIRRNLSLGDDIDVVQWCVDRLKSSSIERKGKNWYVTGKGYVITINASAYTIITAHQRK